MLVSCSYFRFRNVVNFVFKLGVAYYCGSYTLTAEAGHSLLDAFNQVNTQEIQRQVRNRHVDVL